MNKMNRIEAQSNHPSCLFSILTNALRRSSAFLRQLSGPFMASRRDGTFYGWRVVQAAFVLAVFGWGLGFFGPPVFLSVIRESRGWPIALISAAISVHFLVGAIMAARLVTLHRRLGAAAVTKAGVLFMAGGLAGWAVAASPWQLFAAAALSGAGWGTMSAAALNAIVSPWFVRSRPAALGMAYNGGSVGGIIFSPLWVAAINALGFPAAAAAIGIVLVPTLWMLAERVFSRTPASMGVRPDGDAAGTSPVRITSPAARPLPGALLWRDRRFLTLCAGMTLGLFAQIGLAAHLYSLLVPALGSQAAGFTMGLITVMAIATRTLTGSLMSARTDRRLVACAGYAAQFAGSLVLMLAEATSVPLLLAGVVLFGAGFGNATSLPPLIAQAEFVEADVPRVASLIIAVAQTGFAIAPAFFGLIREFTANGTGTAPGATPALFAAAALVQGLAIAAFLAGRR
jgi:MFS family permease